MFFLSGYALFGFDAQDVGFVAAVVVVFGEDVKEVEVLRFCLFAAFDVNEEVVRGEFEVFLPRVFHVDVGLAVQVGRPAAVGECGEVVAVGRAVCRLVRARPFACFAQVGEARADGDDAG